MSWISDVKAEIKELDLGKKKLRDFGLLIGIVLLIISGWFFLSQEKTFDTLEIDLFIFIFLAGGALLIFFGIIKPALLRPIYILWMGFAIALGWIVSRILLVILFYFIVTPIALIAKISGKKFLDLKFRGRESSYWIMKSQNSEINYKKMF